MLLLNSTVDHQCLVKNIENNIINGPIGVEYELRAYHPEGYVITPYSVYEYLGYDYCDDDLLELEIGSDGCDETWEIRIEPKHDVGVIRNRLLNDLKHAHDMINDYHPGAELDVYDRAPLGLHITFDLIDLHSLFDKGILVYRPEQIGSSLNNVTYIYGKLGEILSPKKRQSYAYAANYKIKWLSIFNGLYDDLENQYLSEKVGLPEEIRAFLSDEIYRIDDTLQHFIVVNHKQLDHRYRVIVYSEIKKVLIELRQIPAHTENIYELDKIVKLARLCLLADLYNIPLYKQFDVVKYARQNKLSEKFYANYSEIIDILSEMMGNYQLSDVNNMIINKQ